MKIFWDANVLLDLIDQSRPDHGDALALLERSQEISARNLCAWHSLSILDYLCAKKFGREATLEIITELLKVFSIPATGTVEAQRAFDYLATDFEDALQISSATKAHADYIVSRDTKGFSKSPIPVETPKELIQLMRKL